MNRSPKNIKSNDSLFLDANILLEIVLARDKEPAARKILKKYAGYIYISALTAHLVVHFGTKRVSLPVLHKFLSDYVVLPMEVADFEWAFANIRNTDFEDALQIAVAVRNGCSQFITFDENLVAVYGNLPTINILSTITPT